MDTAHLPGRIGGRLAGESCRKSHFVTVEDKAKYAEAVWDEFLARSGQTRMMGSGEWHVLAGWLEKEIPLRVVLRALADAAKPGRNLSYYGPIVAEATERWRRALA